ncbi:efflux transporter outer membrane subunit [soil metagenome]
MTMALKRLVETSILFALGGCVIAEPPVPPLASVAPAGQWRTATSAPGGAPAGDVVAAEWWRGYGDPILTALVERALANNNDIATAAARVREAAAIERQAGAQLLPSVTAGAVGAHSKTLTAFGTTSIGSSIEPQAQVAWQIDLFGRLADLQGAARERYLASEAARDATLLSVAAGTASGYITLRGLDARLQVARATLDARTEALRLARSRARAGYTSDLELTQAQAEYEATAQIVPQVERAIAAQENGLSVLLGESPRSIERGSALSDISIPAVPAGLPSALLRRRPDIEQAERLLAASDRTLSAQRKAYLPNVQLNGSAGILAATGLGDAKNLFSIGGSILAPIFDGGRARFAADAAAAQRDQAAFAYRGVVLTAFQEVENSLATLDRLAVEAGHVRGQRDALASVLKHATNRYRAGYADYLTQLDAQRGLLAAELALIQNEADRLSATVALYRALGGGWAQGERP